MLAAPNTTRKDRWNLLAVCKNVSVLFPRPHTHIPSHQILDMTLCDHSQSSTTNLVPSVILHMGHSKETCSGIQVGKDIISLYNCTFIVCTLSVTLLQAMCGHNSSCKDWSMSHNSPDCLFVFTYRKIWVVMTHSHKSHSVFVIQSGSC